MRWVRSVDNNSDDIATKLEKAIGLRKADKPEEALALIKKLIELEPNQAELQYQAAWTCDYMGKESAAVPFYEAAIKNGLSGEDLRGALLGLGSTYRCLGRYDESLTTFDKAIELYPNDNAMRAFRALTLYNLKIPQQAVSELLTLLLNTTNDEGIKSYESALRFYSDKLDETWE